MNEDFSEVISKFQDILKEKNININDIAPNTNNATYNNNSNEINDTISSFSENNSSSTSSSSQNNDSTSYSSSSSNSNSNSNSNFDFNLDIETILKIKNIISSLNRNDNCPRNNLLKSLMPYLQDEKKEKLDKYIKIANLLTILEDNKSINIAFLDGNKKGYDYILIITLFLLIL